MPTLPNRVAGNTIALSDITSIRNDINTQRTRFGLAANGTWNSTALVYAANINEMRSWLDTMNSIQAGATPQVPVGASITAASMNLVLQHLTAVEQTVLCGCNANTGTKSCVPAGTKISMWGGSYKNVEDVVVGDELSTRNGPAKVVGLWNPILGNRKLWNINDKLLITGDHMLVSLDGWVCIEPDLYLERVKVGLAPKIITPWALRVGDVLYGENKLIEVTSIADAGYPPDTQLYSLEVDCEFYANGVVVDGMLNGRGIR